MSVYILKVNSKVLREIGLHKTSAFLSTTRTDGSWEQHFIMNLRWPFGNLVREGAKIVYLTCERLVTRRCVCALCIVLFLDLSRTHDLFVAWVFFVGMDPAFHPSAIYFVMSRHRAPQSEAEPKSESLPGF